MDTCMWTHSKMDTCGHVDTCGHIPRKQTDTCWHVDMLTRWRAACLVGEKGDAACIRQVGMLARFLSCGRHSWTAKTVWRGSINRLSLLDQLLLKGIFCP